MKRSVWMCKSYGPVHHTTGTAKVASLPLAHGIKHDHGACSIVLTSCRTPALQMLLDCHWRLGAIKAHTLMIRTPKNMAQQHSRSHSYTARRVNLSNMRTLHVNHRAMFMHLQVKICSFIACICIVDHKPATTFQSNRRTHKQMMKLQLAQPLHYICTFELYMT